MKSINVTMTAILMAYSGLVSANDRAIQACGMYKDIVLKVANDAERGIPKDRAKKNLPPNFGEMVDFVYYFNGVKSKQEIVANQLEQCLQTYTR